MTVLYILDPGTVGGATHAFKDMVIQMKSLGVHPIVCTSGINEFNTELTNLSIENVAIGHETVLTQCSFHGVRWPYYLLKKYVKYQIQERRSLKKLRKEVDLSKVDLIHTNSARNDVGCFVNKKYGIPHVCHIREFADKDFDCISLNPWYIDFFNKHTTKFIAISNAVKNHWIKKGIIEDKILLIYDGVSYKDIIKSDDMSKFDKTLKCVIAGGVFPTKGQHLATEAIGMLPEDIKNNFTLNVLGWYSSNYVERIQLKAQEDGIADNIHFMGARDNIHKSLGQYQIGFMCSRSEGFGLVTAEYMHAQLTVLASDSGANPELITDGQEGLLFENGNAKDLSDKLLKLYYDRQLMIRLSNEAKHKAETCFTDEINAKNIYKLYNKIIEK